MSEPDLIRLCRKAEAETRKMQSAAHEAIANYGVSTAHERAALRRRICAHGSRANYLYEHLWRKLRLFEPTQAEQILQQSITSTDEVARALGIKLK